MLAMERKTKSFFSVGSFSTCACWAEADGGLSSRLGLLLDELADRGGGGIDARRRVVRASNRRSSGDDRRRALSEGSFICGRAS